MFAYTFLGFTFGFIWMLIIVTAWIALALWPAMIAQRKGRSFILWFLLSIFFWWITLFVALLMDDRTHHPSAA